MTATAGVPRTIAGVLLVALVLAANVGIAAAASAPIPVTRGAAEAIFEARTTANQIRVAHGLTASAVRRGFLRPGGR